MSNAMDVDAILSPTFSDISVTDAKYWPWQKVSGSHSIDLCVRRIQAALATLPMAKTSPEKYKIFLGIEWEVVSVNSKIYGACLWWGMCFQHQVSSAIGVAAIQNTAVTIPHLVKRAFEMVMPDNREELKDLNELYTFAVNNGGLPSVVDTRGWELEWWNNLQKASFPCYDVKSFLIPIVWHLTKISVSKPSTQASHPDPKDFGCLREDSESPQPELGAFGDTRYRAEQACRWCGQVDAIHDAPGGWGTR